MKLISAGACAAVFLGLVACGGDKDARETPDRDKSENVSQVSYEGAQLPKWFSNPFLDNYFGATASERKSLGGLDRQRQKAVQKARVELARTISTRVQASFVSYFTEGGEMNWGEGDQVQMNSMAQEMAEDVSKQITDQVLKGSRQQDVYVHPNTGEVFVWVIIDPNHRDILEEQIKASARKVVDQRAQIKAELKAKDALERLDKAIDAELNRGAQ